MQGFDKQSSVNQIIKDLGIDPSSDLAGISVSRLWDSYSDKAALYPRLQDLYTRRQACENMLGGVWLAVDYAQADVKRDLDQYYQHLQGLRSNYHDEIVRLEDIARASAAPSGMAQMTATAPVMADPSIAGQPFDPNWPGYRGDPRYPSYRPR